MELNFKCSCGSKHEVRMYDECRYCAKPISVQDWAMANLTLEQATAIAVLKQKEKYDGETQTKADGKAGTVAIGRAASGGETSTQAPQQETARPSGVVVEKRTSKRLRESVVD